MDINQQLKEALGDSRPTLVEFYSNTCSHCAAMAPIVEQLKKELGQKCNIIQIEGNINSDLRHRYNVTTCPSWLLFKDGKEVWRDSGKKSLHELRAVCLI